MAKINVTRPNSGGGGGGGGNLQMAGGVDITSTLVAVTDTNGNASTLRLSTLLAQFLSGLRITTNDDVYLDLEDGTTNNRWTVSRPGGGQKVAIDYASNPTGSTTIVGSIRTYQDGTNLSDIMTFREDGLIDIVYNLSVNNIFEGFLSTAASGTSIVLTVASKASHVVTGSGGQVFQLPNATTIPSGAVYYFNNNQSSGAITINNNSGTLIASVPSGGFTQITLLSNATAAGTWERHEQAPSNVSWSTNTFNYPGSITGATWNGVAIADAYIASAATWNAKQDSVITTNRQTASYTLALTDASKLVEMNVATANNLTVPLNGTVAFPIGTQILLSQYGAGQTTVVATSGVTINSSGGKLKLNVQYSGATLIKIATNEWYLFGDIAA
jgi:hypothetical protein